MNFTADFLLINEKESATVERRINGKKKKKNVEKSPAGVDARGIYGFATSTSAVQHTRDKLAHRFEKVTHPLARLQSRFSPKPGGKGGGWGRTQ